MKKNLLVALLVVAALAVLTTGVALAQESTPPTPGGRWGMRPGMMGRYGYSAGEYGPMHEYMEQALASALGISVDTFESERAGGKTAYQIALDLGFTADQIPTLLADARTKAMEAAAADGVISQQMLDWMKGRQANGYGPANCPGIGQGWGGGMMRGWGYQQSNPQ